MRLWTDPLGLLPNRLLLVKVEEQLLLRIFTTSLRLSIRKRDASTDTRRFLVYFKLHIFTRQINLWVWMREISLTMTPLHDRLRNLEGENWPRNIDRNHLRACCLVSASYVLDRRTVCPVRFSFSCTWWNGPKLVFLFIFCVWCEY